MDKNVRVNQTELDRLQQEQEKLKNKSKSVLTKAGLKTTGLDDDDDDMRSTSTSESSSESSSSVEKAEDEVEVDDESRSRTGSDDNGNDNDNDNNSIHNSARRAYTSDNNADDVDPHMAHFDRIRRRTTKLPCREREKELLMSFRIMQKEMQILFRRVSFFKTQLEDRQHRQIFKDEIKERIMKEE